MDDDELMLRIQAGDREAFVALVERHQQSLIGFLFRNTRDIQLAEDLTQETFLKLYNTAWDYLPRQKFRGYMFRIAYHLLIDVVRRREHDVLVKAVRSAPDGEGDALARLAGGGDAPEDQMRRQEFRSIVDELLEEIPNAQRQTFVLHHFSELPLAEVADAMETNVATTKSRLRLARRRLQEKLLLRGFEAPGEEDEDDEEDGGRETKPARGTRRDGEHIPGHDDRPDDASNDGTGASVDGSAGPSDGAEDGLRTDE